MKRTFANKQKGFTLIEIMVAVTIFAIVMVVAIGSVLSITNENRKAQALNSVISNLNFAVDAMVRSIRTGADYSCSSAPNTNCPTLGSNSIYFTDSNGHKITYIFKTINGKGQIQETDNNSIPTTITADDVDVKNLTFYITGNDSGGSPDGLQPKVLLQLQGTAGTAVNIQTTFNIQTLISQRLLDD